MQSNLLRQSDLAIAAATTPALADLKIAVILPCYNEEVAIGSVVNDFQKALPQAKIYVYDNNSSDRTISVATAAGAIVRKEPLQGKGNVVRRMFADIDADVYVLCDGDITYDVPSAPAMVECLVNEKLDMVVGCRISSETASYRAGHRFGNALFTGFVAYLFGNRFTDILSGYRIFSRRYVKSFPALARGFEIETELTVHALELRMPIAEIDTPYKARPEGSLSKLSTFRDGFRILLMILTMFRNERPMHFFGILSALFALLAIILIIPIIETFLQTGLVPRFPTAILSGIIVLLSFLSLACGLVLDTVTHGRREMKRLAYLTVSAPGNSD